MLESLEPRLFLNAVNAYSETRCGPFGDEPDLSLPGEIETVARRKVTLLHSHRDVVGRVDEQIVFTKLLQQRAEKDGLVAAIRLSRHQHLIRPLQQLEIVSGGAHVIFDLARNEIQHPLHAGLARTFSIRLDVASKFVHESSQRSLVGVSNERSVVREDNRV